MYHRIGKAAYKSDLRNIVAITSRLGEPQLKFPSVHVAGTNGKGSTCSMVASVLMESGYKVGLFTSPHLRDFRERIRINGEMPPQQMVVDFVEEHHSSLDDLKPSFFEWTTALAFHHFAEEGVDIGVIEVGLGGRLDSTNVVRSIVTCITSIGMDHADLLGDSLEKIALEKAGIIKEHIPIVIPTSLDGAIKRTIIDAACSKNAPLHIAPAHDAPSTNGYHQRSNAGCAVGVIDRLVEQGFQVSEEAITRGIQNVKTNSGLRGRWELLQRSPRVIADVAHNEDGVKAMLNLLKKEEYEHLHVVLGAASDKDTSRILPLFPKDATYYFCKADIPRGMDRHELKAHANGCGLLGSTYESVELAFEAAKNNARTKDLILITGSVFVVAEII